MNPQPQIELLEASLQRLSARLPETPVAHIMVTRLLLHVGRGMAELLEQQIRPFGLAEAEFRVLTALFSQAECAAHPGDLCARTAQRPANMSRICDALVGRGLITRDVSAHDRRRMVLKITPDGEELVRRLLPPLWLRLRELYGDISEAELTQLVALLKRVGLRLDCVMAAQDPEPAGDERGVERDAEPGTEPGAAEDAS